MKIKYLLLLAFMFSFNFSLSQKAVYIDEKGDTLRKKIFLNKWRDKELRLIRWDSVGTKNKRICTLKKGLYQKAIIDFSIFKKELENITNFKIKDSSTILIHYVYKDDLCTANSDNKWTKREILERKIFLEPIKLNLNESGITFICLFEKGILLKNKLDNEGEYFFMDQNNYFKSNIFLNKVLCGSYAIIKPNGQTIIRNGESRADRIALHLKPSIWSQFFPEKVDSETN